MTTEILTILISILATVITALISAFSIIYKDRKTQRITKHKAEKELEELKKQYYQDITKIKHALLCVDKMNSTVPEELKPLLTEILNKEV
jgi:uncharacterized membrane protein YraQ (UPF0718 family)